MPSQLTVDVAKYLIFIDFVIVVLVLGLILIRRPRRQVLQWGVAVVIMLILSEILARVGAAVYNDPRPFATDHVRPLFAHAADNGFPSDHGLLAAAIVAAVLLAGPLLGRFAGSLSNEQSGEAGRHSGRPLQGGRAPFGWAMTIALTVPFIILGILVDWARVGSGIHHVTDVVGSAVFVAIAAVIAFMIAPAITRLIVPRLPPRWLDTSTIPERSA